MAVIELNVYQINGRCPHFSYRDKKYLYCQEFAALIGSKRFKRFAGLYKIKVTDSEIRGYEQKYEKKWGGKSWSHFGVVFKTEEKGVTKIWYTDWRAGQAQKLPIPQIYPKFEQMGSFGDHAQDSQYGGTIDDAAKQALEGGGASVKDFLNWSGSLTLTP
jgi:hypothetical protein